MKKIVSLLLIISIFASFNHFRQNNLRTFSQNALQSNILSTDNYKDSTDENDTYAVRV